MFKPAILIALLLMTFAPVIAAPVMTHARFKQLSNEEKDQYIVRLMEMMVSLEGRYEKNVGASGVDQERWRRYVEIKELFEKIFLDSAYANAPRSEARDWNGLATDFQNLMSNRRGGRDNCIFAGWVSRTVVSGGETLCNHPDFVNGSSPNRHRSGMTAEAQAYPAPAPNSGCGANDRTKIQCSPLIFGYKKEADGSLFCVSAANRAHNSSFLCMQAALGSGATPDSQDSKEDRLKALRRRLTENPGAFESVWKFVYQTCICEDPANRNANFSQAYANYMRPHQTCYGLMEMMAATALDCQEPALPFPPEATSAFTGLRNFMRGRTFRNGEESGALYSSFLQEHRQENAQQYASLCRNEPVPPTEPPAETQATYQCQATCQRAAPATGTAASGTPAPAAGPLTCTYAVTRVRGEASETVDLSPAPTQVPENDQVRSIRITPTQVPGGVDCTVTVNGPETPPARDEGQRPAITLNPNKRPTDYEIRATITNYTNDWTFRWVTRGGGSSTPTGTEVGGSTTLSGLAGNSEESTGGGTTGATDRPTRPGTDSRPPGETGTDSQRPPRGTGTDARPPGESTPDTPATGSDDRTTTRRRLPTDYEVCGVLERNGDKIEACTNIERVEATRPAAPRAATPSTPFNFSAPAQQQPQVPQRPAADTSAVGIR